MLVIQTVYQYHRIRGFVYSAGTVQFSSVLSTSNLDFIWRKVFSLSLSVHEAIPWPVLYPCQLTSVWLQGYYHTAIVGKSNFHAPLRLLVRCVHGGKVSWELSSSLNLRIEIGERWQKHTNISHGHVLFGRLQSNWMGMARRQQQLEMRKFAKSNFVPFNCSNVPTAVILVYAEIFTSCEFRDLFPPAGSRFFTSSSYSNNECELWPFIPASAYPSSGIPYKHELVDWFALCIPIFLRTRKSG